MSNETYERINRPYSSRLSRSELDGAVRSGYGVDQEKGEKNVESGNDFDDLWIENWIKSRSWQPKSQGFFLDAKRGYIEGMHFAVGGGIEMYGNDMFFYDSTKGVNMTIANAGSGYLPGELVNISGGGGNASVVINKVSYPAGQVQGFVVFSSGTGYSIASNVLTSGGSGTGFRVNINSVSPVGAIKVFEGDKATINFQRKFFPSQNFIMQKRVGINSPSESQSDCVFEMYYQNPPQTGRKNKILIGTGGEASTDASEYSNELHLYATDYIQIGTKTQRSRGISEFIIENSLHDSGINAGGSRFRLTYNQTDVLDYLRFDPDSGLRYPWKGGGMLFSSFSSIHDIFPERSRPAFGFDLGVADGSGRIWNFDIHSAGSGYAVNDIVTVSGGTTSATIKVLGVTGPLSPTPGEVIDCKLLTHGSGYAIMSGVNTSGGSGSGFRINITDNQQKGNTWIFSTLLPNVCDELIGAPAPSIGSAVYIFKDIYAHRHYFSTTHYLQYHPEDAVFEFSPGGSIYTHGDVYAEGNIIAGYLSSLGGFFADGDPGVDMTVGTPTGMIVKKGIVTQATPVTPAPNGTYSTGKATDLGSPGSITISGGVVTAIVAAT